MGVVNYLSKLATQIRAEVPESNLPDADTEPLFLMYAVLLLAKGAEVEPHDVHNAWAAWMTQRNEDHESLSEFSELPESVQRQDLPFVEAIRRVARRRSDRT
jgi:hypothetical protein